LRFQQARQLRHGDVAVLRYMQQQLEGRQAVWVLGEKWQCVRQCLDGPIKR
jgi:hypothetical protein